jgi:hypothetical protein
VVVAAALIFRMCCLVFEEVWRGEFLCFFGHHAFLCARRFFSRKLFFCGGGATLINLPAIITIIISVV